MSLLLNNSPRQVIVLSMIDPISIGPVSLSLADFCRAVEYVLTNTDLTRDREGAIADPRYDLVKTVSQMIPVPGYNSGGIRLYVDPQRQQIRWNQLLHALLETVTAMSLQDLMKEQLLQQRLQEVLEKYRYSLNV